MLKQSVLGDLSQELATTRRLLQWLPDEHLSWRPHDEGSTLAEIGTRIVNVLQWQLAILQRDDFDITETDDGPVHDRSADLLRRFDTRAAEVRNALDGLDDAGLIRPWTLRRGNMVIFTVSKAAVMRSAGIGDMVHHRGQLAEYLRQLGVPFPGADGSGANGS